MPMKFYLSECDVCNDEGKLTVAIPVALNRDVRTIRDTKWEIRLCLDCLESEVNGLREVKDGINKADR